LKKSKASGAFTNNEITPIHLVSIGYAAGKGSRRQNRRQTLQYPNGNCEPRRQRLLVKNLLFNDLAVARFSGSLIALVLGGYTQLETREYAS
jgi:hypothetical protein